MPTLTILDFQSSNIRFENRDGRVWVSLTDMAKASGKRLSHWNQLNSTKKLLSALESVVGKTATETIQGSVPSKQGTWAIEEVAIEFAGWCSIHFKIWMLQQIKTLMTQGYVALPQTQQPQTPKLSANKQALEISRDVREITDVQPESLHFLEQTEMGIKVHPVQESYGKNVDQILEDLMGLETTRPKEIAEAWKDIYMNKFLKIN